MKRYDIAIIGGGAAGLAAAISAKRTGKSLSVAVIERLPKTGRKILATGNGRCNLSNSDLSQDRYHGSCRSFLKVTDKISVPDFFESLGVICEDDGYGRIYPHCRSAASVLDALRLEAAKLDIEEICGFDVKDTKICSYSGRRLPTIISDNETITARKVILAGGGKSQPALGSNGSIADICGKHGIKLKALFPALVPLKTDPKLVKPLKGQRADANVMFFAAGKIIASRRGEVQFTDGLISGICVFDLSYLYEKYGESCELRLDLLPDMSAEGVYGLLRNVRSVRAETSPEDFLSGVFTRTLGAYIIKQALPDCPKSTGRISDEKLHRIADKIKSLPFPVIGTAGYERSQVTGGGIVADELTDKFELKKMPNMYACGELLDIFGDCGGYNLDFAFSSGIAAGKDAAIKAMI